MTDPYGRTAVTDREPRCWKCGRKLAHYLTRPWGLQCSRCKAPNRGGDAPADPAAP